MGTSSTQLRNLLATSTQSGIADLSSRSASTLGLAMSPSLEVSWASLSGTCCKHGSMTRHCTPAPPHSVTLADMETFFGPWTEIKVLEEIMMGPEAEQVQRFKVDKMTERIFFMLPIP